MRPSYRPAGIVTLALFASALTSCGGEPTEPEPQRVGSIAIQVDSIVVEFNVTAQIPVLVLDRQGNQMSSSFLTWSIDNSETAAISPTGVIRGLRAGRTFARAEKDGVRDSVPVVVRYNLILTPSEIHLVGIGRAALLEADLLDARGPTDGETGEYTWQSRSPSIARVTHTGSDAGVLAVGPGTTWIIASEPNGAIDSARVTVVPGQLQFVNFFSPALSPVSETTAGVGLSDFAGGFITIGHPRVVDPMVVTLQQSHPELLRLRHSQLTFDWGERVEWIGLGTGVDTIVATAPGWGPDTLIVRITRPVLQLADVPSTGYTSTRLTFRVFITDSLDLGNHTLVDPPLLRLDVSSSDPGVLNVEDDSVVIGPNASAEYHTVPIGVGTASLTFTDPSGRYASITSPPITVVPTPIVFGAQGMRGSGLAEP